ncbi:Coenzyme PQQ synthesis protein E [Metallosphaera sp. J1]|uniref:radical SAM/SPASM domain-containing protein n=1 Tax=Metallosphaera javensis (ex Hofmann et al. 2022) TaxID=99938 RepID=UPI001EDEECA6|nr:radical SAM protein [Metallosphaera javensis (ex Hofmann et al. 2022)]MCG3109946.1 Coenzyme PQQ synthesis protein E [Metallosphaera javensis (ex Hofmann et al. 2022)]
MVAPYVVVLESTKACDLACKHCRARAIPNRLPGELTTEEVKSLVDDLSSSGVKLFVISGGDALKRDDIFDILSYSSRRITTALSPSGSRIDVEVAKRIRDTGVSMVSISVDGPEEIHDEFRGVKGAFRMAKNAVESLHQAGIPVQINSTISRYNVDRLHELRRTVESLNPVYWDVFMLIPTGRATREMMISPAQAEEVMRTITKWRMEGLNVRMTCAPYLVRVMNEMGVVRPLPPDKNYGRRSVNGARGCMAGNGYAFVAYDGTVYPCGFLPTPAGNVRFRKFSEIYEDSPVFKMLREPSKLGGKCGVCEYRSVCGGCRARAFSLTENFMDEDPFCTYVPRTLRVKV